MKSTTQFLKGVLFICLMGAAFTPTHAQAPQGVSYQSVVRDASGTLISNQAVSLRFTIHQSTMSGATVYQEEHAATTTGLGLVNLTIGAGNPTTGTFASINWGGDSYYLQVELDPAGGSSYVDLGATQLMSVPYALYAETAGGSVGPTGPQGLQGVPGQDGADGATGPQGPTGADGADGTSVAIQGSVASSANLPPSGNVNGDGYITSDTGHLWVWDGNAWVDAGLIQGPQGPAGANGNDGATGPQGPSGADGAAGPQGPTGPQGLAGVAGPTGPQGLQGVPGQDGADGATGPQGPAGADGADGTSVAIQGSVASSANLPASGNVNGDGYITSDTGHLWLWDGNGWVDAGLIQGPQGPAGANGSDGATGPQGPSGADGATGPQGPTGLQGLAGIAGPTGPQGLQGVPGQDGANGATGPQGPTGANGNDGATGPQGPTGADGATGPLVAGTSGQTLRHDGTDWVVSDNLFNDGTSVGIGTTTPASKLELSSSDVNTVFKISNLNPSSESRYALISVKNYPITNDYALQFYNHVPTSILTPTTRLYNFLSANSSTSLLRILENGNVGVGNISPDSRLHVDGEVKANGFICKAGTGGGYSNTFNFYWTGSTLQAWIDNINVGNVQLTSGSGSGQWNVNGSDIYNTNSGNVGIGTSGPGAKTEIMASSNTTGEMVLKLNTPAQRRLEISSPGSDSNAPWVFNTPNSIKFQADGNDLKCLYLDPNGSVGIGTTNPQSKLAVNGKITCKEVEVTLANFPDYVFESNYSLMSLTEVETYINTNGHLPNVPSACEVEENGLGLGEMNKILLEKVEELTLHTIRQQKLIDEQAAALRIIMEQLGDRN